MEHELKLAKETWGLVRRILNRSDLSRGNNTCEGPELSHWEPVGQIGRSWRYFTKVRILLFTMSECEYEDGNDNSLLMLIVIADVGKVNIREKLQLYKSNTNYSYS